MKKITLLTVLMASALGFSQQVVIEGYETPAEYTLNGFGGLTASVIADPTPRAAGNVMQMVSVSSGQPWQGSETILLDANANFTTDITISVDVYCSIALGSILLGAENGVSGAPVAKADQAYTTPNTWQTITFTLNEGKDGSGTANGAYGKITIFPNFNGTSFGSSVPADFTLYVDNLTAEEVAPPPPPTYDPPATAAPNQGVTTRPWAGVRNIYNDYFPAKSFDEYPTSWSSGTASEIQVVGDNTQRLILPSASQDFVGFDFQSTPIDCSSCDRWHIEIFTDQPVLDKVVNIKFIDFNNTAAEVGPTQVYTFLHVPNGALPALVQNSWLVIDAAKVGNPLADMNQIVFQSSLYANAIFYDNFYLYNSLLGVESFKDTNITMYHNPVAGTLHIEAKGNVETVALYNMLGQEVVASSPNSTSAALSTSGLASGVYVVKVSIDGVVSTSKFTKQ